jgi:hypothetical protein
LRRGAPEISGLLDGLLFDGRGGLSVGQPVEFAAGNGDFGEMNCRCGDWCRARVFVCVMRIVYICECMSRINHAIANTAREMFVRERREIYVPN